MHSLLSSVYIYMETFALINNATPERTYWVHRGSQRVRAVAYLSFSARQNLVNLHKVKSFVRWYLQKKYEIIRYVKWKKD